MIQSECRKETKIITVRRKRKKWGKIEIQKTRKAPREMDIGEKNENLKVPKSDVYQLLSGYFFFLF